MADVEVITLFNFLPELPELLQVAVSKIVRKAAFDIQALAANQAPVDTGFLKSSIYVVTHDESTYSQVQGTPPADAELLPEVEKPSHRLMAFVCVGASYGVYQEFGTVNQAAQPYLTPAVELVAPEYIAALRAIEDSLEL